MGKKSVSADKLRSETDYSNLKLLDFSIETFRYYDENGIKLQTQAYSILIEKNDSFEEDNNLLSNLLDDLEISRNAVAEYYIKYKGLHKIVPQVASGFFVDFYRNAKGYKTLFKKFGSGWFTDHNTGLGNGVLLARIEEQLEEYTFTYLLIHLKRRLSINSNLQTIVDENGSPLLYQSCYNHLYVCKEDSSMISFGDFERYNNDKIRTFKGIKVINSLYLYNNDSFTSLGELEEIKGACIIRNSSIKDLGCLKKVFGDLVLENCSNLSGVNDIKVNGHLNLRNSNIYKIQNCNIDGNLYLNKMFSNNFIIENSNIKGKIKFLNPLQRIN